MTWGGNTFGFHVDGAGVHGTPVFHKYANTVPATRMLDDLLTAPLDAHGGRTVAQLAAENLLELWLEPGKALVDHAGISVARVEFVKQAADGSVLVNLDLSRDTVTPADQEVMVDPIVLPRRDAGPVAEAGPVGVFFAGRLCLERDLITNHKVWLDARPRPGIWWCSPIPPPTIPTCRPRPRRCIRCRRNWLWRTGPGSSGSAATPTTSLPSPPGRCDALRPHHRADR